MSSPVFIVTNKGLAAASFASPTGPHINVTGFIIGDAYGYEATKGDEWLRGNMLYGPAKPMAYRNVGDNTLDIICRIPPDAGPFAYGEVGILIDDGAGNDVLFAKAVFEEPQMKYSNLGTNVADSATFHCLIKLDQSIAVFKINSFCQQAIFELDKWSDVLPADIAAYGDVPSLIVRELDTQNKSSLLTYSNDLKWTVATNYTHGTLETKVASSSVNWVNVSRSGLPNNLASTINRHYVLEFSDGTFRSASKCSVTGSDYRFDLNPDPLTEPLRVGSKVIVHSNKPLVATRDTLGVVRIDNTLDISSTGIISAPLASTLRHGIAKIGDNIDVKGGVISVPKATLNGLGVVTIQQIIDLIAENIPDFPETADIIISPDTGNRLVKRPNGYGVWDEAPPNLRFLYISSSTGNDSNPGTKAAPLKTINEATNRIIANGSAGDYEIRLKCGDHFDVTQDMPLTKATSLLFIYYGSDKYPDEGYPGWYPSWAKDLVRPVMNIRTVREGSYSRPAWLSSNRIQFEGIAINLPILDANGPEYIDWGSFVTWTPSIRFSGCEINLNNTTLSRATNKIDFGRTTISIAPNTPLLTGFDLVIAEGDTEVVQTRPGYPDIVAKATNVPQVINLNNLGRELKYNRSTKTAFGWDVGWDIFA